MEWKDNKYGLNKQIICKDKLIDLSTPHVMGILNITTDSFYASSRNQDLKSVIDRATSMIAAGVDILDIGGVSTRPGADLLSSEEENSRILPVLQAIRELFPDILISVDTFRSDVARKAIENGADIINDVYGGKYDPKMYETVADLSVPYILMHCRGDASDMQSHCNYEDVVQEVFYELSESVQKARNAGVKDIIIDLGFGFSKNLEQNFELLQGMPYFDLLDCPILVGVSRKSMIYKYFGTSPAESMNGTTILNTFALLKNADIIRVHDVAEAVEVKKMTTILKEEKTWI